MMLAKFKVAALAAAMGLIVTGCSSTKVAEDDSGLTQAQTSTQTGVGTAETAPVAAQPVVDPKAQAAEKAAQLLAKLEDKRVHFDFDRSEIKNEFEDVIALHAKYLNLVPDARVTVEGHCDERGSREYNLALGERRANSVKKALMTHGIDPSRIEVISFGVDVPLIAESNEEAWRMNRRAEFRY